MSDTASGTGTTAASPGLPPNFQSVEALTTAYLSLQSQFTKTSQELANLRAQAAVPPTPPPTAPPNAGQGAPPGLNFSKAGQNAGRLPSQAAMTEEFNRTGSLSDDTKSALKAGGWNDGDIESWEGSQAVAVKARVDRVANLVGGRTELDALVSWANKNMPEKELDRLNEILASGNDTVIEGIVLGLNQKRKAGLTNTGINTGTLPNAGNAAPPPALPFASAAELTKAVVDARYGRDLVYTKDVQARMVASMKVGR